MTCIHHWVTDPKGFAHCKRCGNTRQFAGYETPVINRKKLYEVVPCFVDTDRCAKSYVRVR